MSVRVDHYFLDFVSLLFPNHREREREKGRGKRDREKEGRKEGEREREGGRTFFSHTGNKAPRLRKWEESTTYDGEGGYKN